jgi:hypothetical protein
VAGAGAACAAASEADVMISPKSEVDGAKRHKQ